MAGRPVHSGYQLHVSLVKSGICASRHTGVYIFKGKYYTVAMGRYLLDSWRVLLDYSELAAWRIKVFSQR